MSFNGDVEQFAVDYSHLVCDWIIPFSNHKQPFNENDCYWLGYIEIMKPCNTIYFLHHGDQSFAREDFRPMVNQSVSTSSKQTFDEMVADMRKEWLKGHPKRATSRILDFPSVKFFAWSVSLLK
ncbi:hypothetical protein OCU04_012060 [Sclerotinia nivalis]|uniref:Uncharacterized protein n=1 Tax=Sclerotinia nivalis TaxID=352851 RepID=A0A9X0AA59_9HELO|nr:hypothetical protein OCU04_012060 [Sclerotinia nivalis]